MASPSVSLSPLSRAPRRLTRRCPGGESVDINTVQNDAGQFWELTVTSQLERRDGGGSHLLRGRSESQSVTRSRLVRGAPFSIVAHDHSTEYSLIKYSTKMA